MNFKQDFTKRIAIVNGWPFHYECLGFLLEMFKNNHIDIYTRSKGDKFNWLGYYKSLYSFNVIYTSNFDKDILIIENYLIRK